MSNKIFSLCFAVAMLSNIGSVLPEKEGKDLWWDPEVELEDQRLMKMEEEVLQKEERKEKKRLKKLQMDEKDAKKKQDKATAALKKRERKEKKEALSEASKAKKKKLSEDKKKQKLEKKLARKKKSSYDKEAKAHKKKEKNHSKKDKHKQKKKSKKEKRERKVRSSCGLYLSVANEEKKERVRAENEMRSDLIANWSTIHHAAVKKDYQDGRYADLYKHPAWPSWSHFFHQQNYARVSAHYTHADDAYDSCGTNRDASILALGDRPVRLKDISLVSRLAEDDRVDHADLLLSTDVITPGVATGRQAQAVESRYLGYLANSTINVKGTVESYGFDLDFAHYVANRDVAIGIHIPILYKKHRVDPRMTIEPQQFKNTNNDESFEDYSADEVRELLLFGLPRGGSLFDVLNNEQDPNIATYVPNAFMRRYGSDTRLFIQDILREKSIERFGGSAAGLGDISLYVNIHVTSLLFDRMVFGFRAKLPTGKEESPSRLWGPSLGTGLTELSVYASLLLSHNRWCNPHAFIEGSFGLLGHVEKRVPRRITLTDDQATARANNGSRNLKTLNHEFPDLAFAKRVRPRAGQGFSEFDSCILGCSSYSTCVRMAKGFQIDLMLGNMVEEFISRRGFFDMYYKLMLKWKDRVSQPDLQEWNAELLWRDSQAIGHTLGCEYTYQYDRDTRAGVGVHYTLAGKRVLKEFGIDVSVNHSF